MSKAASQDTTVTPENFGRLLIESLEEAVEVAAGRREPARRVRRAMTVRDAEVAAPGEYDSRRVVRVREKMGLSQHVFAQVLNASPETVKAWEQGKREPDGMALALLEVAETHPEALMARVRKKQSRARAK